MKINKIDISKSLQNNFLQEKPQKELLEKFKESIKNFIENINENETEENLKNDLILFLNSFYSPDYYINTKDRTDLVIHTEKSQKSAVGVLFEIKHPTNKSQMIIDENINCKGFQQLVLYFLRERINNKNIDIKHLILTNIYDWYIFDATEFERIFLKSTEAHQLVKQFNEWQAGQKSSDNTDLFYNEIAKPFIENNIQNITFTYFNIKQYVNQSDNTTIQLFKILSPFHLLKQIYKNDSNTLNAPFYYELLHIIGLEEQTENGVRYLKRCKHPEAGSLIENTMERIRFYNNLDKIENLNSYGETKDEQVFSLALELCIVWLNRILFLKLLEAQLLVHHSGEKQYKFLTSEKIKSYSKLDNLFFEVLAVKYDKRSETAKKNYGFIPFLNSSLFEPTKLEKTLFLIGQLDTEAELNLFKTTVLKDFKGNKLSGILPALQYFLDFLDAYNFGADAESELIDDKTIINSAVLGLIFEKINGYKEGSFYTPGYITMYMCRETIRRAVVEKFNNTYNWNCNYSPELTELFNQISKISIEQANDTINSMKICDPAVGSGHFLVSALNEMIAVKADLNILTDRKGKLLRDYKITVLNDELEIKDQVNEQLFKYVLYKKPFGNNSIDDFISTEKQRIQETIFHQKKYIIENCLFGVDINQNSVNITRLRLWIELLKNAYYTFNNANETKYLELQTLPNIDINIKCGNSLIHRFPLNTDLSKILKSIKFDINYFKSCVDNYKNTEDKELKKGYEKSIELIKSEFKTQIRRLDPRQVKLNNLKDELQDRFLSPKLLQQEYTEEQKKKLNIEREKLLNQIQFLENEIADELTGVLFLKAFEWRFEFPEVLDSTTGDFQGFDIVVGNPPYIRRTELSENLKPFYQKKYKTAFQQYDLYILFIEHSFNLLKNNGKLCFINPKYFVNEYGTELRKLVLENYSINLIVDVGQFNVFNNAATYPCINLFSKYFDVNNVIEYYGKKQIEIDKELTVRNPIFIKQNKFTTIEKYKFIFNENPLFDCILEKISNNSTIIKNLFECRRGLPNNKIIFEESGKYLGIKSFQIKKYCIENNFEKINFSDTNVEKKYCKIFSKEMILLPRTTLKLTATLKSDTNIILDRIYFLQSQNKILSNKYVLALLNSKLINFWFEVNYNSTKIRGNYFDLRGNQIENIPIKTISKTQQKPFIKLAENILENKTKNKETLNLENEIDNLVYQIYELTDEEIEIVENAAKTK